MSDNTKMVMLNLQLFAEAGGGAAGSSGVSASNGAPTAAAAQSSGMERGSGTAAAEDASAARDAAVQGGDTTGGDAQGNQGEQKAAGDDRRAKYAQLRAEYQDLFDEETSRIVRERVRKTNAKMKGMMPIMDQLAVRYGTEPGDLEALQKAIDGDRLYLAGKAEETGTTEEIQSELERYRTREATERREAREAAAIRRGAELTAKAKEVQKAYPGFNIRTEMQNPQFVKLMDAGLDMRTAYEVAHRAELQKATVSYTAQQAAEKSAKRAEDNLTAHVRANGMRPAENGAKSAAPTTTKVDPSKLTKEQIDDYIRRARNGERITF